MRNPLSGRILVPFALTPRWSCPPTLLHPRSPSQQVVFTHAKGYLTQKILSLMLPESRSRWQNVGHHAVLISSQTQPRPHSSGSLGCASWKVFGRNTGSVEDIRVVQAGSFGCSSMLGKRGLNSKSKAQNSVNIRGLHEFPLAF